MSFWQTESTCIMRAVAAEYDAESPEVLGKIMNATVTMTTLVKYVMYPFNLSRQVILN